MLGEARSGLLTGTPSYTLEIEANTKHHVIVHIVISAYLENQELQIQAQGRWEYDN